MLPAAGAAELEELPTDSLKRIRETYKAMKAALLSMAAIAPARGAYGGQEGNALARQVRGACRNAGPPALHGGCKCSGERFCAHSRTG